MKPASTENKPQGRVPDNERKMPVINILTDKTASGAAVVRADKARTVVVPGV